MAPSYLYFGCRNEAKDFYYRSFWELSQRSGVLADPGGLVTAFSRDQASKVYVSHRVRETSAQLWAALQQVPTPDWHSGLLVFERNKCFLDSFSPRVCVLVSKTHI